MCTYSMIVDHYRERWTPLVPQVPMWPPPPVPSIAIQPQISQEELDEFRRLLQRAREYDRKHNQPDCDLEEKKAALKTLAQQLGVDISFVDATEEPQSSDAVDPQAEDSSDGPRA